MIEQPIRTNRGASLSLRGKLLLFAAALVLVPGVWLAAIAQRSGSESLELVIGRQLAREAGHAAELLAAALRAERETLASFARQDLMREVRVADIDKRVSLALATLRDGSEARVDYWVVDAGGSVVASSDPARIGSATAWPGAAAAEGSHWGPIETRAGGARLAIATPIPDPDAPQRRLGTLVGLLDFEALRAATLRVREDLAAQGIAADVLVWGADGSPIGGANEATAGEAARLAALAEVARAPGDSAPDFRVHDAQDLIIGRASLASDLPDWKLLVVEARAHALAPAHRLSQRLALTMGLALAAALAVATLAARRVVRPLSELTRAIRGLSRGDARSLRVPVRSDDEVGTLASAFNDMASELDRAQRELVEAEKFAFVGELASGVAHEIRTSLGVLGSSAQILARSLPEDAGEQTAELAQMIRAEVTRLGGVVDDLLNLDRARSRAFEAALVSEPVFRAADFVAPQARERGISLERRAARAEAKVRCEPDLIQQAAVNLLVNAVQALASGGRIEVRILEAQDGYGGFEVRDDGPGIPEGLRARVFQPFVTAREGGVGLGLTFVKRVVHEHRGRVDVDSGSGAGTRIRIALPLAEVSR
jgi:signal transduction histidine kinase